MCADKARSTLAGVTMIAYPNLRRLALSLVSRVRRRRVNYQSGTRRRMFVVFKDVSKRHKNRRRKRVERKSPSFGGLSAVADERTKAAGGDVTI